MQWTRVDYDHKIDKGRPAVFIFTLIKHLFKWRDALHIGCLVEKFINHIVLKWANKFNVIKQVKKKALEAELPGKLWNLSKPVYHQHFYLVLHSFSFSEKGFHSELFDLVLPYT